MANVTSGDDAGTSLRRAITRAVAWFILNGTYVVSRVGTGKVVRMTRLDSVERAVADIAAGKAVVVIDDEDRENEGDLIFAAEKATPELVAFMVRYTSGYLCVPLDGEICDRLGLLPMLSLIHI